MQADSKEAVVRLKKDAARVAADIMRDAQTGGDEKSAAVAANKILQQAQKSTDEFNQRAESSARKIKEQAESASFNIQARLSRSNVSIVAS